MKIMLPGGGYQEITKNEQGEKVIRYAKDGKEYSEEEWEERHFLSNETLSEIRCGLDNSLGRIGTGIEVLDALQVETGRIEEDVVNMDGSLSNMGLMMYDIQHKIIMINSLLFHTIKEMKGHCTESNNLNKQLFDYEIREKQKS